MSSPAPDRHLAAVGEQYDEDLDPLSIWERQAREHRAQADLRAAQEASERLRQQRHDDYMAAGRRYLERLQLDQAITAAELHRAAVARPVPYREDVELEAPPGELQELPGRHQALEDDLDERARDLFARRPDAGRGTVMAELGVSESAAKDLVSRLKPAVQR